MHVSTHAAHTRGRSSGQKFRLRHAAALLVLLPAPLFALDLLQETPPTNEPAATTTPATPVEVRPKLDPAHATPPAFPSDPALAGVQGAVTLSLYVNEDGSVGEVKVAQTSGYPQLDDAAAAQAPKWRFKPGTVDGKPTAMWHTFKVQFRSKDPEPAKP